MGMAARAPSQAELDRMAGAARRRSRGRRARPFDRALHAARQLCRPRRDRGIVQCAEASQCGLFHPYPRRIEQGRRSGRGGDRHRPDAAACMSRSCISNARALDNWGKAAQILGMIEAARAEGLAVDCDAYPYAAGSNPLKNLLPQWVQSGGIGGDAGAPRAARDPRAHSRRDRARRAQQLGPHPVLGQCADLDLAASAATCGRDGRPRSPRRAAATRSTASAIT